MGFTLKNQNGWDRIDGPNPINEDYIEFDKDPRTAKRGEVLKTIDHQGFQLVLVQGQGLWEVRAAEVPTQLKGKFTSLKAITQAVDRTVAEQHREVADAASE